MSMDHLEPESLPKANSIAAQVLGIADEYSAVAEEKGVHVADEAVVQAMKGIVDNQVEIEQAVQGAEISSLGMANTGRLTIEIRKLIAKASFNGFVGGVSMQGDGSE